jgi:hypothetical protein
MFRQCLASIACAFALLALAAAEADAADRYWVALSGNFGESQNWSDFNGGGAGDRPTLRLNQTATAGTAQVGNLTIGADHAAAVEVTGGSTLQVPSVSLGAQDGGDGILTVSGNNSSFAATTDINVGGTSLAGAGMGVMNIEPAASVATGISGALRLWAGGVVNLNGGTLYYNSLVSNGGHINFNSGRITGINGVDADATTLTTILGPGHELGSGREIASNGATTLYANTNIDVNGGPLLGTSLTIKSGATAGIRGGGAVACTTGISTAGGGRILLGDGLVSPGTTLTNGGEIYVSSPTATIGAGNLINNGLVSSEGRVQAALINYAAGEVRVAASRLSSASGMSSSVAGLPFLQDNSVSHTRVLIW